jgi:hypothetical protein
MRAIAVFVAAYSVHGIEAFLIASRAELSYMPAILAIAVFVAAYSFHGFVILVIVF